MKTKNKTAPVFFARAASEWKGMRFFCGNELCRLDWIISLLILAFLFVTCVHSDVKLTGNRSFLMYEHFADFYQASYEQSGGYWANYLPSTFIAYAIWNLPLYLTGHVPEAILTNSFVNMMWYKLLPVILYFVTAQLMYLIGKEMGFGEKKSLLCKFAFLIFPMGVFSQFIFSQYDIFTVFFMVLGFWLYLRGKLWKTALMFGIAATFKYHAVLYFLALILLKEKKIRNLIRYTVVMALPLLVISAEKSVRSAAPRKKVRGLKRDPAGRRSFVREVQARSATYSSPKLMPRALASLTRSLLGSTYLSLPATSSSGTRHILPLTCAIMTPNLPLRQARAASTPH